MSTGTARSFAVRELAPAVLPAQLALQGSPAELGRALRYVAVCGEHAYVAASDGHLHWYTLHAAKPGKAASWHLEKSIAVSSIGKAVERVYIYATLQLVGVWCGPNPENTLRFYAYPSLGAVSSGLAPIKGVQGIADDADESAEQNTELAFASICLLKRKKLVLVMVERHGWGTVKEIPIERDAFIARRFNDVVCLASPSEYSLVHLDSGAQTPLGLPISQSTEVSSARIRPSIVPVAFDEHGERTYTFLITSHSDAGTLGAFLRADGEPTDKLLEWPSHPRSVVAEPPYVCALLRNDTIEVHDLRTMRRVQQIRVDASDDPRFLLRIVGSKTLLTSGATVDEHVVQVDDDEVGAEKAAPMLDEPGAVNLPIPPFALEPHWKTVRVLLGFKRSLSCLALPTPASTAWKCAEAQNWSEADHALHDTELDEQAKIAAVFLGINHVCNTRFSNAIACFLRGGFDVRLLLAKYPSLRQFRTAPGSLYATLKDAWDRLPASISDLVEANLATNYGPDMDTEALRPLKAQLERRADAMLVELLEANVQGGGEGRLDAHSALLALALGRDATVPTSTVDGHLDACHVDKVAALLASHHRYGMQALLFHKHGRITEALSVWTAMLDKTVEDPVDTVALHEIAPHIQQLTEQEDLVQYGLWLAKHDTQLGLDALRRVEYSGTDSESVLASLRLLDTHAAEALLEHIVFTSAEQTENLHAELCARLVEILVEAVDKHVYPPDATVEVYGQSATEPFFDYLAKRASLGVVRTRIKLMVLLEHSSVLDRAQTLEHLTPHAFLAFEQAIVLGKLGRVSDALRVLALDVHDALSAEAVCLQDGRVLSPAAARAISSDASIGEYVSLIGKESLFVSKPATSARLLRMLLYLYLDQSNLDRYQDAILHLLISHTRYFSLLDILPRLPNHWSVACLEPFLVRTLRSQLHRRRLAEVVKGTAMAHTLSVSERHWQAVRKLGGVLQEGDDDPPIEALPPIETPPPRLAATPPEKPST